MYIHIVSYCLIVHVYVYIIIIHLVQYTYNGCSMLCSVESAKAWLPDLLETVEKCEVNGTVKLIEEIWRSLFSHRLF